MESTLEAWRQNIDGKNTILRLTKGENESSATSTHDQAANTKYYVSKMIKIAGDSKRTRN